MAEVKRRGIRLIPCSGRTHASMYPFLAKLDTGLPYIGGNGSEIVGADHRLIEQLTLDVELAREICAFLVENGLYVQVYTDEAFYYSAECDIARRYKQSSGMKGVAVGDLCAFLDFATPKVLSVGEPEDVLRLMPLANERFLGRAAFTMSKPYFLEAEPPGATKGEALLRLADRIGIVPERTVAFGDSLNDKSLLAFTPNSVAMANAHPRAAPGGGLRLPPQHGGRRGPLRGGAHPVRRRRNDRPGGLSHQAGPGAARPHDQKAAGHQRDRHQPPRHAVLRLLRILCPRARAGDRQGGDDVPGIAGIAHAPPRAGKVHELSHPLHHHLLGHDPSARPAGDRPRA